MILPSNNPALNSWVSVRPQSHFPIQNLPFGVFSTEQSEQPRVGVAIGDQILDLRAAAQKGLLNDLQDDGITSELFDQPILNPLIEKGKLPVRRLRESISDLLNSDNANKYQAAIEEGCLFDMEEATMHMPLRVGDYTDFYSSQDHAQRVGSLFRDPENALPPNWKHLPIGYHGRSSSIVPSGTDIHRPAGQILPNSAEEASANGVNTNLKEPYFSPCKKLDFELEMAFVTFQGPPMGNKIDVAHADNYIFGLCLFNDWSARDIQKFEYQPLGPFLSKNFASTISPWIVTLDALEPFRTEGPIQDPEVRSYLKTTGPQQLDIHLEVSIKPNAGEETTVSRSNTQHLYWSMAQQLAHHTINGCPINAGDMMASGTISGPEPGSEGCLLEKRAAGGTIAKLKDGSERAFLRDHDTVTLTGYAALKSQQDSQEILRVGFGEATGKVLP